ncbi:MAG: ribonuclease HII [bacterium]|nr:ribonuclease HII [bacterium]
MKNNTTKSLKTHSKCVIGIDEAGRGPLAGPVAVGAVMVSTTFNKKFFKGIKDSKQLNESDRDLWYDLAIQAKKEGVLDFSVSLVAPEIIDKRGITFAIAVGIKRCLKKLNASKGSQIFLDGGLRAPGEFLHQLTVIKGDEKIPIISLASVVAKVTRDKYMKNLSKKIPEYGFHLHKGYGTFMHKTALKLYGASPVHRKSFLKKSQK